VELIRRALALVERGVPIGQVGGLIESELRPRPQRPGGAWGDYLDGMATEIARFDERELDRIYDQALSWVPSPSRRIPVPAFARNGALP
jgi:hypothetical protein